MSRTFWVIAALAGLVLVLLLASNDTGTVLGMNNDMFAGASITALWGAFIASSLFRRGTNWGAVAIQLAIWALIFVSLMAGYMLFNGTLKGAEESGGVLAQLATFR